jgi:hypothetical protein
MSLVFALASCAGSPPPAAPPEAAAPAVVPAPLDNAPADFVKVVDPSGRIVMPDDLQVALYETRKHYDAAKDATALRDSWREADVLAGTLEPWLDQAYAMGANGELQVDWLLPATPGMQVSYVAEGTAVRMEDDAAAWTAKAASTPDPADDAFFALVIATYGTARMDGNNETQAFTWDYGGCSNLGTGKVLALAKQVDAAAAADPNGVFAKERAKIRADILSAVMADSDAFPYCDPATMQPMADDKLQGEAKSIVAEVELSPEEKAAIEARIPKLKGVEFHGG